ncbi:MAG: CPBP family intramembrane metalloprotease [Isosphaeraceae bacterium]|nr:CPBP family intramembrane metalloprotease [Isosphaeraceae bacterium]
MESGITAVRLSRVWTIFRREVVDQLRDRRTLFMIFILPILLYPILGIGIAQLSVAFEQKPRTVVVLGAEYLPDEPPLLTKQRDGFNPALFDAPAEARLLRVQVEPPGSAWHTPEGRRDGLRAGRADVVMLIPADVQQQLAGDRPVHIPLAYDSADEQSRTAARAVREIVANWKEKIVQERLERDRKPASYVEPIRVKTEDVATIAEAGGSVWAKLFPFLLVMMALTGAFYPAVDLCAGEKERGTMETLLISPASRAEIVLGKFLTVMLASMATALLNLASMGVTGWQMAQRLGAGAMAGAGRERAEAIITPPSLSSALWMILLLVPLSAFFSAICLALAVLARSMKEGQYYMTPLYLVALPLVFVTLAPGIELDLFTSLVPITGVSLLLRALMQGQYAEARRFFLPVLVPILVYGAIALRWAADQFRRESVLFREAERFHLLDWLRHLVRDRQPTPGAGEALACFALMLTSAWFLMMAMAQSVAGLIEGQLAFILAPPIVLALLLTSSPRRTLRLYWPEGRYLALAVGLALTLNPLVNELRLIVESLFPAPEIVQQQMGRMLADLQKNFWLGLLALAVVPAICEEVAFRGFILSGFEQTYRVRTAILLSAFLFGFLHVLLSLFQQLFNATLLGIVLGLLAVKSRSIVPGIVFHLLNNGLALLLSEVAAGSIGRGVAPWVYRDVAQGLYHGYWIAAGGLLTALLLVLLGRDRHAKATDLTPWPRPEPEPLTDPG